MKISCKTCGANLEYVPSIQKAHCEHCGNYFNLSEIRFDDSIYEELEQYTCSSCGAELISDGKTGIVKCIYCGGKEFVRGKTNKDYVLNGIFPFEIDKEEFVKCYEDYFSKLKNVEQEFKNELKNAKIIGYYLPYSFANNFYRKQYTELLNELLEEIIPYNFKNIEQMNPLYLDGFVAEIIKTKKEENDIKTSDPTFFWVPVWVAYIEYNGDNYYIVMNGQTGEMAGIYKKRVKEKKKFTNKKKIVIILTVFIICCLALFFKNIIAYIINIANYISGGILLLFVIAYEIIDWIKIHFKDEVFIRESIYVLIFYVLVIVFKSLVINKKTRKNKKIEQEIKNSVKAWKIQEEKLKQIGAFSTQEYAFKKQRKAKK